MLLRTAALAAVVPVLAACGGSGQQATTTSALPPGCTVPEARAIVGRHISSTTAQPVRRPAGVVARSLAHSLCFGLYHDGGQIGFARVISDLATFGYLGDVFVLEAFRGRGLARWLMEVIHAHPELQGFRRWVLLTRDAHALYAQAGYTPLAAPDRYMERWAKDVYRRGPGQ